MLRGKNLWILIVSLLVVIGIGVGIYFYVQGDSETASTGKAPGATQGEVTVKYEGGQVTSVEFDKYLAFSQIVNPQVTSYITTDTYMQQFLQEYVGYKILASRLGKLSADKQKLLDEKAASLVKQVNEYKASNADLKKLVDDAKLTDADFKYFYQLITTVMQKKQDEVTDAAIKERFNKAPADYNTVSIRHVLVGLKDATTGKTLRTDKEALARAQEVKAKLEAGGVWKDIASKYSDDPGSKDNGGLYEDQRAGNFVAAFKEAVNKQDIGKIGAPVKTEFGYHVIQVEKRKVATYENLTDEQKTSMKQELASESLNKFMSEELPKLIKK